MDQRNPYNNPHFRNQIQQPDAPEPQNRVRTAVDILLDPSISRMRGLTTMFFTAKGSHMRTPASEETPLPEDQLMSLVFGPEVLGPFPKGRLTLMPPNYRAPSDAWRRKRKNDMLPFQKEE